MSKAAAARWLADTVGRTVDTVQVPEGRGGVWRPGPRTLTRNGNRFKLDGSTVSLTSDHTAEVDGDTLVLVWHEEDGTVIHTTTYTRGQP